MEDLVRVRVEFEDRHLLTKPQRLEGLKRCWILLKPELSTISDLYSHLIHIFSLHRTCPHGVTLSMDDFVLPLFESTCILKDKDIIRVKKKASHVKEVIKKGDGCYFIQQTEVVQKQPMVSSNKLLAIEELQVDSGGCKSKDEDIVCTLENTINVESPIGEKAKLKRKRENSDMLQGSKRKRMRKRAKATSTEKPGVICQVTENGCTKQEQSCSLMRKKVKVISIEKPGVQVTENNNIEQNKNCSSISARTRKSKDRPLKQVTRSDIVVVPQADDSVMDTPGSVSTEESDDQAEANFRRGACEPHADGVMKKVIQVHSRSARRKQASRKKQKELLKSQNKEHINSEAPTNDIPKKSLEHQKTDQNNEADDELVPIVIRPGHIRFESADVEHLEQQTDRPVETLQWNGTTSKKKGQKWGREKINKRADGNAINSKSSQKLTAEDGHLADKHVNYESLPPISRLPKVSDVIAYRMVELSSIWCPELSSFQVGKVQSYDSVSLKIVLLPVPEYPIFTTEKEADEEEPNVSPYKEDGSLEIDYPSLVDVRLFKANTSEETAADSVRRGTVAEAPASNCGGTLAGNNIPEEVASPAITPVNNWELALANNSNKRKAETPISTWADMALVNNNLKDKATTCTEKVASRIGTPVSNWELTMANSSFQGKAASPTITPVNNWQFALANNSNKRKAETPISTSADMALVNNNLKDKAATCTEKVASRMGTPVSNWELAMANSSPQGKAAAPNCTVGSNWDLAVASSNIKDKVATPTEKRPGMGWEQINLALNQKKAELSVKDGWGNWTPTKDTTTPPWSYRALRRSALGPTVAFLRSKNRRY